ncbi:MAG: hypothetical protein M1819_005906 [Sarea resinae]|nr:MAG: hypothetical protein M1819_005906 [Sarea resinae]
MATSEVNTVRAFFLRQGLTCKDRADCDSEARKLFPREVIVPSSIQGYCSYTLFAGESNVIQFRQEKYRLDIDVVAAAKYVFGSCAPTTTYQGTVASCGLLIYIIERLPGVTYQQYRINARSIVDPIVWKQQVKLCQDFAGFLAQSWHQRSSHVPLACDGKVGSAITFKLQQLAGGLDIRFQPWVEAVLERIQQLDIVPLVVNHGDVVASNIMVNPDTGRLNGLVDWAEAEALPFGTCLYGLEELLGFMTPQGWVYYERSEELRRAFWEHLEHLILPLKKNLNLRNGVRLAQHVGVLLWHGFAWDDGAINRVVNETTDADDIQYLDSFLLRQPPESTLDFIPMAKL